ncbi:MAG: ATP-dependent RecD-like DNA helicase [Thermodesulfobacteriota bacterium]|nr:ATP-dependent RecD-like DNA helicase [Thermodesulfobacteriota bacterium]
MITIQGNLDAIRYRDEKSFYTVARLKPLSRENTIAIVGIMPDVAPGQTIQVTGQWTEHPRYGQQFKVKTCEITMPATTEGILQYLASGLIRGIGASMARRITTHFGEETLDVMDNAPDRLREVEGIGEVKAGMIRSAWREHRTLKELMGFLQEKGVDAAHSAKLFRLYGEEALTVLQTDPFRLTEDLPGKGFVIADTITLSNGARRQDPRRIKACVTHVLDQAVAAGNVFMFDQPMLDHCEKTFDIDPGATEAALQSLAEDGEVVRDAMPGADPDVTIAYPAPLYDAEAGIAERIRAIATMPAETMTMDTAAITEEVVTHLAVHPSAEQLEVLENIFTHRMLVITGGPGTGKTTLIRAITAIFEDAGKNVVLTAPTGRAAKRLSEVSGKEAATIHRLLGFSFDEGTFNRHRDNQLRADAVIVDEASMIDIQLFYHLLCATPVTAVLVLVGDMFQLPPVGPGNVLRDLIRSEMLPVFCLSEIFRQAETSAIITTAHMIRNGKTPDLESAAGPQPDSAFWFIEEAEPAAIAAAIIDLCTRRLPDLYGFDPMTDIQVLTPMHKGEVGTINLNQLLQKALNPPAPGTKPAPGGFYTGDKVMNLRNNYKKEVFNGDIGTIDRIDPLAHAMTVNYDGRMVAYDFSETDELTLAYAVTAHKSQGSEYPAVVIPMTTKHYPLLERNLLYTAVTRAKERVVLVGTKKAVGVAMKKDNPRSRLSLLAARLNPDLV